MVVYHNRGGGRMDTDLSLDAFQGGHTSVVCTYLPCTCDLSCTAVVATAGGIRVVAVCKRPMVLHPLNCGKHGCRTWAREDF